MRTLNFVTVLLAGIFLSFSFPGEDFEGKFVITSKIYDKQLKGQAREVNSTYFVKGDKVRVETNVSGAPNTLIRVMDLKEKKLYNLVNARGRKVAMKMEIPQTAVKGKAQNSGVKVTKTGESKKIRGYSCQKYVIESNRFKGESWVTEELEVKIKPILQAEAAAFNQQMQGRSKQKLPGVEEYPLNGFPIHTEMKEKGGKRKIRTEVKQVEEQKVADENFDISGYQVMDMKKMMQRRRKMQKQQQKQQQKKPAPQKNY